MLELLVHFIIVTLEYDNLRSLEEQSSNYSIYQFRRQLQCTKAQN